MNALTNDQLAKSAPSIFSTLPSLHVSGKFTHVPTIRVVEAMRKEGWFPSAAVETRARAEDRKGFQKHMVRFRRELDHKIGDYFPEVVLVNAHDGTTAYQLHAGLFRLVCSNGMVVADSTFAKVKVKHIGYEVNEIIEGSFKILNQVPEIVNHVEQMKSLQLSEGEQTAFARAAVLTRYDSLEESPVQPERLLAVRRNEDAGQDLWRTFNRVQENLTRGGVRGINTEGKRGKVRQITNIDKNVNINKALWALAEEMRNLKQAS